MTGSVLFHVQYLLGIGHLQRTLRIANALAGMGIGVTLVSGGEPVALPRHPALRVVQLPAVRARDAGFELIDANGQPIDNPMREARRAMLLDALVDARPDAVVIEGFPFARRAFRFELDPLIEAVRAMTPRPRLLCSVRDIVVVRDNPQRHREIVERVKRDFDAALVHADPALVPFEASFPAAPEIADRLIYTGYVSPSAKPLNAPDGSGAVIVSAGGGAAGFTLLQTALAARRSGCLANSPWRLFTGMHLPDADFAALCDAAPAGVSVERFHNNLVGLLGSARASVSQAGYNTVLDILQTRARAVVVPYAEGRETEQLLRAERLAALGVVHLVREADLSAATLTAAIDRAASRAAAAVMVDMNGAVRSAEIIAAML